MEIFLDKFFWTAKLSLTTPTHHIDCFLLHPLSLFWREDVGGRVVGAASHCRPLSIHLQDVRTALAQCTDDIFRIR